MLSTVAWPAPNDPSASDCLSPSPHPLWSPQLADHSGPGPLSSAVWVARQGDGDPDLAVDARAISAETGAPVLRPWLSVSDSVVRRATLLERCLPSEWNTVTGTLLSLSGTLPAL